MVRTYQEVPKRAKNSIKIQIENLCKRYGDKPVRLVALKIFSDKADKEKLEKEIAQAEEKLRKLKSKSK